MNEILTRNEEKETVRPSYTDLGFKEFFFKYLPKLSMRSFFYILILIVLLITVSSALADLNNGLVSYYACETNTSGITPDSLGARNLTAYNGAYLTSNGIIGNGCNVYQAQHWNGSSVGLPSGSSARTVCFFANQTADLGSTDQFLVWYGNLASSEPFIMSIAGGDNQFIFYNYNENMDSGTNSVVGVYNSQCWVYDGSKVYFYLNDVHIINATQTINTAVSGAYPFYLGGIVSGNSKNASAEIDEVAIWNRSLSRAELTEYYNNITNGLSYPFTATSDVNNVTFTAVDSYDASSINNFTVLLENGTSYTTTTGTLIIVLNTTLNYNFSYIDAVNNYGYYFNKSLNNIDLSGLVYPGELTQAYAYLTATELITNNTLTGTFKINGTIDTTPADLKAGTYNFSFTNASYYQKDSVQDITALFNNSVVVSGVYDVLFNITIKNAYSGASINNFSGWIYNNESGYNESFNTTTGLAQIGAISGNWTVYVESPDYSIGSDNYQNYAVNTTITGHNFSFLLYSSNSIYFTVYDEELGTLLNDNVSITLTGNSTETTYYTDNATLFLDNITDGEYTVKAVDVAGNFSVKTYTITVADRSTQSLAIYLTRAGQLVTFNVLDYDTALSLEGASFTMYRLINSTWITVESKTTDVTGRAQFSYTPYVKYKFIVSLTDYSTKIFYLDPVLFSEYNIRMEKTTALTETPSYTSVSISYYPKTFFLNDSNNFTWIIQSSNGTLETYNLTLVYPGGSYSDTGTNAVGEQFNYVFNITSANESDRVNVTYCYDSTLGGSFCFTHLYSINGAYSSTSWLGNLDNTYGLGLFERVLIATVSVILIAGFFSLFLGAIPGAVIGLFLFGYFKAVGFIPLWAILPSILVGFIILTMRGGQN